MIIKRYILILNHKYCNKIKKLSRLNKFLTIKMTTKFLLINKKIEIYREELKNVKSKFINIKTLQIMDSKEIISYLLKVNELQKSGVQLELIEDVTGLNNLVFQIEEAKFNKITGKKNMICQKKIYYKYFFDELKCISLIDSKSKKSLLL